MKNSKLVSIAAAIAMATLAAPAMADVAYSFESAPTSTYGGDLSLGFVFTANTDAVITRLGYFDLGGDGFAVEHDLALFSGDDAGGSGNLLGAATLAAGLSGTLGENSFRYVTIVPIKVHAGQTYTVAGLSKAGPANDPWLFGGPVAPGYAPYQGFSVNPVVSIGDNAARYRFDTPTLVNPDLHYSDYRFYAVNFDIAAIPEPATWAMMLAGFGGVGAMLRRRRSGAAGEAA